MEINLTPEEIKEVQEFYVRRYFARKKRQIIEDSKNLSKKLNEAKKNKRKALKDFWLLLNSNSLE